MNWNDINWEKSYDPVKAYSQSKIANILFTVELAKKLEGTDVTCYSLHPGSVRTELIRYTGENKSLLVLFPILVKIFYPVWWVLTKSSSEGNAYNI